MHHRRSATCSRFALAASACAICLAAGERAEAQTGRNPSPTAENSSDPQRVEEIVVTAQKRVENLQNVPISVSAVTAAKIQAAGVGGTLAIGAVTPGLTVTQTTNSPLFFLRGVGTSSPNPGDEGSVNLVVDGVYYITLPGSLFALNNVERIEVLRGPQGTLFGRNAAGGVINIITRDPKFKPSASIAAGYGNYDTLTTSFYGTAGLVPDVAADLAVQYNDQGKGFGVNRFNGAEVHKRRDLSIRSKILWNATPETTIKLSGDYTKAGGDEGVPRQVIPGAVGPAAQVGTGRFWDVNENLQPRLRLRSTGVGLNIHHDLPWAQLTNIVAYRKTNSGYDFDQDGTAVPLVNAVFNTREHQLTEEIQLASRPQSKIKWIIGGFYLGASSSLDPLTLSGAAFARFGGFQNRHGKIDTRSFAGFAQATVPLGSSTNFTGGIRYTSDKKDYRFFSNSGLGVLVPTTTNSATFNRVTWRLALDHKLSKSLLVYASASTGFKTGNYNILDPTNPVTRPETLTDFEIGAKSELFDHRVRFNLAGFYYDYKNIQVSQLVAGTSLLLNAASGTIYGLDVDFETARFGGFSLSGGAEFLHARYDKFPGAPASFPSPATCIPTPTLLPGPRTGGNTTCAIDAAGRQLVRAPDLTTTLTASYLQPTSIGDLGASITYAHSSSYGFEPDNRLRQKPTNIVNGQLSWISTNQAYELRLWAKNLTNEQYYTQLSSSLGDTGASAPPRTYGVSVAARF